MNSYRSFKGISWHVCCCYWFLWILGRIFLVDVVFFSLFQRQLDKKWIWNFVCRILAWCLLLLNVKTDFCRSPPADERAHDNTRAKSKHSCSFIHIQWWIDWNLKFYSGNSFLCESRALVSSSVVWRNMTSSCEQAWSSQFLSGGFFFHPEWIIDELAHFLLNIFNFKWDNYI